MPKILVEDVLSQMFDDLFKSDSKEDSHYQLLVPTLSIEIFTDLLHEWVEKIRAFEFDEQSWDVFCKRTKGNCAHLIDIGPQIGEFDLKWDLIKTSKTAFVALHMLGDVPCIPIMDFYSVLAKPEFKRTYCPALFLDLAKWGCIDELSQKYLAKQIFKACSISTIKQNCSLAAREDFKWHEENLAMFISLNVIWPQSFSSPGCISSGEWLCSILCSGLILAEDHVRIAMDFVNPLSSLGEDDYVSGAETWQDAPSPMREILDLLDQAAREGKCVAVRI